MSGEEYACERFVGTEWFQTVLDATVGVGASPSCFYGLIGASYWYGVISRIAQCLRLHLSLSSVLSFIDTGFPTVPLADVRLMFVIDPLGSPYNETQ